MPDIFERTWPITTAKGAVVIVHGLGEHSGRYEHVAQALNTAGYTVHALDLRGHGRSIGFPGDMGDDVDRVIDDVVDLCVRARGEHDKVVCLAHSMGTLLTVPAVPKMPDGTLTGLVLSGIAGTPGPASAALVTEGRVPPESVSRDPAIVQAYIDDPLVFEKVPMELMALAGAAIERFEDASTRITVPVLLIHGEADVLCDVAGAQTFVDGLSIDDKALITYPGLYHEVLNEPERDRVIGDVVQWLDKHVA